MKAHDVLEEVGVQLWILDWCSMFDDGHDWEDLMVDMPIAHNQPNLELWVPYIRGVPPM